MSGVVFALPRQLELLVSPIQPERRRHDGVAGETGGGEACEGQKTGQRDSGRRKAIRKRDTLVSFWILTRQYRANRCDGVNGLAHGVLEDHALRGELLDLGRRRLFVTIGAHAARAGAVEDDEKHVELVGDLPRRRGGGLGGRISKDRPRKEIGRLREQ